MPLEPSSFLEVTLPRILYRECLPGWGADAGGPPESYRSKWLSHRLSVFEPSNVLGSSLGDGSSGADGSDSSGGGGGSSSSGSFGFSRLAGLGPGEVACLAAADPFQRWELDRQLRRGQCGGGRRGALAAAAVWQHHWLDFERSGSGSTTVEEGGGGGGGGGALSAAARTRGRLRRTDCLLVVPLASDMECLWQRLAEGGEAAAATAAAAAAGGGGAGGDVPIAAAAPQQQPGGGANAADSAAPSSTEAAASSSDDGDPAGRPLAWSAAARLRAMRPLLRAVAGAVIHPVLSPASELAASDARAAAQRTAWRDGSSWERALLLAAADGKGWAVGPPAAAGPAKFYAGAPPALVDACAARLRAHAVAAAAEAAAEAAAAAWQRAQEEAAAAAAAAEEEANRSRGASADPSHPHAHGGSKAARPPPAAWAAPPPKALLRPLWESMGWAPATQQYALAKSLVDSGKLLVLDQLLRRLKTEGHRVLLFCQVGMGVVGCILEASCAHMETHQMSAGNLKGGPEEPPLSPPLHTLTLTTRPYVITNNHQDDPNDEPPGGLFVIPPHQVPPTGRLQQHRRAAGHGGCMGADGRIVDCIVDCTVPSYPSNFFSPR